MCCALQIKSGPTTVVFAPASPCLLLLGYVSITIILCIILGLIIVQLSRATCGSRFPLSSEGRGGNCAFAFENAHTCLADCENARDVTRRGHAGALTTCRFPPEAPDRQDFLRNVRPVCSRTLPFGSGWSNLGCKTDGKKMPHLGA